MLFPPTPVMIMETWLKTFNAMMKTVGKRNSGVISQYCSGNIFYDYFAVTVLPPVDRGPS